MSEGERGGDGIYIFFVKPDMIIHKRQIYCITAGNASERVELISHIFRRGGGGSFLTLQFHCM